MDITGLPLGDLNKLRQSLGEDVQLITNNFGNLKVAQSRYTQALESLTDVANSDSDASLMIPLTGSLYVPGRLSNIESVIVDVGTGYFLEKSIPDARKFLNDKLVMLAENIDKIGMALAAKRRDLEAVTIVFQKKMQAAKMAQDKHNDQLLAGLA